MSMEMALSISCFKIAKVSSQYQVVSVNLQSVKRLVKTIGIPSVASSPVESLRKGNWVKLICGASFQDVADIRNLSLVYTLAGVDCIDCAAEASVVSAVKEGIEAAIEICCLRRPWVMISVNDDQDLHFRKAEFDPEDCPLDCSRPCQMVCPANAISLYDKRPDSQFLLPYEANGHGGFKGGVITERCYGCGRCSPVCPYDKINMVTYIRDAIATVQLLERGDVDALEIHTSARQTSPFERLWDGLRDSIRHLKLVAVSLPDNGETTIDSMNSMYSIMEPQLHCSNLWQLDGRPMSGDIGRGATRASIAFARRLAGTQERPNGFLQLAGGTNAHTVEGLRKLGLFQTPSFPGLSNASIAGVAYGGYARKIVGRILSTMPWQQGSRTVNCIEQHPEHLLGALREALSLVGTVKCYDPSLLLVS